VVVNDRRYEIFIGPVYTDPVSGYPYPSALMTGTPAQIEMFYIYRTISGGNVWHEENFWSGVPNVGGGWLDTSNQKTDQDLIDEDTWNNGAFRYPLGPVATFNAARIFGYQSLPASGFSSRKLKLRATNPADPLSDTAADATLGANAPLSDTSGVVGATTQTVAPGATTIPVTDTIPFTNDGGAAGGWARIGDLAIRYTGIGSAALTGIPTAGIGSLTAAVRHGAVVLVHPRLVGIPAAGTGAILEAIRKGDTVTLRFEIQDDLAVAVMAERLKIPGQAPVHEDGIIEEVFSDSRFGITELSAHARAKLIDRKDPHKTVKFETRDDSIQVGRLVSINISSPPIAGTFRIQAITFSEIAISGGLARVRPLRSVTASTRLYTFANLLRQLRGREGGVP
jgi:hypothetical protein